MRRTEFEEVRCAMNRMKMGRASGPSFTSYKVFLNNKKSLSFSA